jgi:putative membrane protein
MEEGSRRTHLAAERTQLAWWRTGLTAVAVGIGVGRILPALDPGADELPFVLLGCAFAAYGIILIVVGSARGARLARALEEKEGFARLSDRSELSWRAPACCSGSR